MKSDRTHPPVWPRERVCWDCKVWAIHLCGSAVINGGKRCSVSGAWGQIADLIETLALSPSLGIASHLSCAKSISSPRYKKGGTRKVIESRKLTSLCCVIETERVFVKTPSRAVFQACVVISPGFVGGWAMQCRLGGGNFYGRGVSVTHRCSLISLRLHRKKPIYTASELM